MSEEVKFTEEELKQVKEIQESYFDIQNQFGQTSLAKLRLDEQLQNILKSEKELTAKFEEIQSKERNFLGGITEKYGEGQLNPETGIFTQNKSQ